MEHHSCPANHHEFAELSSPQDGREVVERSPISPVQVKTFIQWDDESIKPSDVLKNVGDVARLGFQIVPNPDHSGLSEDFQIELVASMLLNSSALQFTDACRHRFEMGASCMETPHYFEVKRVLPEAPTTKPEFLLVKGDTLDLVMRLSFVAPWVEMDLA